jgi:hypothetical protein
MNNEQQIKYNRGVKRLLIVLLVAIVALVAFFYFSISNAPSQNITSFEECVAAGNPTLDSYPAQCNTKDGKHFTQDIGNELEKMDLITIENPRPNQKVTSPLKITGKARGTWFFEANFPVRLLDENGKKLAESHATSNGEWMTEDFVAYESELEFKTEAKKGKLILEKSNPSGLVENEDRLEVPVIF